MLLVHHPKTFLKNPIDPFKTETVSVEAGVGPAFLLFLVSSLFGFRLLSHRFSLGMSCPFGRGVLKHGLGETGIFYVR